MGIKRTLQNIATFGAVTTSAFVANAQTQPKINVYLIPGNTQLLPGQSSYLDVIVDNRPLTGDTADRVTWGADVFVQKPQNVTFTGAEFPATMEDLFYNSQTGQTYDMLPNFNFVGQFYLPDQINATRLIDFTKYDSTQGPLNTQGKFERVLFTVDNNAPIGYCGSFSLNLDRTVFSSGNANEQPYQVISSPINIVPEVGTLSVLGLGTIGLLTTRAGRKKVNNNKI
jgi:hypothetical protein